MWTMEELMELKTPFLTMQDITKKDWEHLDFELEKYDIAKEAYDLDGCKVLAFVLQQIHYNKMNFNEVPNFIRNGRQFQELVVKYNPELSHILFPEVRKQDYANLQKQVGDLCTEIRKYAEQYDALVEIHTQTDQKTEISVTDEYFEKKRIQDHYDEKFLGKKVKIKQDGTIHVIVKVVVFDEDTFGQGSFAVTTDDNRYLYEREFDVLD